MSKQNRINIISLGCAKNLVDSEILMRQLSASGYEVVFEAPADQAGTVIINTCGFIQDAKQESIDTILKIAAAKEKGQVDKIIVSGCLSERYKEELVKNIPEVDLFVGVNRLQEILKSLGKKILPEILDERCLTSPGHYAYVKIAEGCDRTCSFCAIPLIRGKYISRMPDSVIAESVKLAGAGVKELILIAQDTSYFGTDLCSDTKLVHLIKELEKIPEIEWIRLQYMYPAGFPAELFNAMRNSRKVCRYLDIPLQHISDKMLKIMRRGHSRKTVYKLIEKARNEVPGIALRTTLLVGHPGETENDFLQLVDFVEEMQFDRLGIFTYSHEEGTHSYKLYKDSIPQKVKRERADTIMALQQQISEQLNTAKTDTVQKVVIDGKSDEFYSGRTQHDSPEVDNEVLISTRQPLVIGEFYNIRITGCNEFDLFGEVNN
ncbi:MAG: 30S ribosomal protein S12 methylthiotransferase RimO [Bacteroidetes bacterium]|nr:30S ribosomal protein S12 methylthiotransferase RimO [Bacteroidota bacterium]